MVDLFLAFQKFSTLISRVAALLKFYNPSHSEWELPFYHTLSLVVGCFVYLRHSYRGKMKSKVVLIFISLIARMNVFCDTPQPFLFLLLTMSVQIYNPLFKCPPPQLLDFEFFIYSCLYILILVIVGIVGRDSLPLSGIPLHSVEGSLSCTEALYLY